ncbi:DUF1398 domain-containing protein [Roseomonas terrae]|uniref:DUF1398 domain-containing protein n=1 Tax=Neoroseomonas terrae TaxID=424799 RepID=A0ABS5EM02_9PROT|nr:DUF1398 family protein [Neoroseomonas terrae]MBR0652044.1 DUF1398 domain-containing protein [Neoroseomonas terrae]
MDDQLKAIAAACLDGAENNTTSFPEILATLIQAGFEGYAVDYRRATTIYYRPDGDSVELPTNRHADTIGQAFDIPALQAAIREAQQQVPGYTYAGFCAKAMAAGCVGYVVSFPGRRAVYSGRTAETHVELFPN